jgi:hypothetical protein
VPETDRNPCFYYHQSLSDSREGKDSYYLSPEIIKFIDESVITGPIYNLCENKYYPYEEVSEGNLSEKME